MKKSVTPYSNTNIAVLANELCQFRYNMTLGEHRIFKLYVSKIANTYDESIEGLYYTVSVAEYAETWGLRTDNARNELKEAAHKLWRSQVTTETSAGSYAMLRWICELSYSSEDDSFKLCWSPTVHRYISNLKGSYAKLSLVDMKNFNSSYSFRLYEILISRVGENGYKKPRFSVEELMDMLQVPESYRSYNIFKQKVLTPCTKELRENVTQFSRLAFEGIPQPRSKKIIEIEWQYAGIGNKYAKQTGEIG